VTPGQDAVGIYAPAPSPGSRSWSGRRRTWFFNLRTGASLAGALELREVLDILTAPTRNNGTTRKLR
jgi:hypothetical protein